jgi:hypothetical protein
MSFVILTDKDGVFRTEADASLRPVERYDYLFYGTRRARFTLAEVLAETRLRIVAEEPNARVNLVPSKFLAHFDTIEAARRELASLTSYGTMDTKLQKVA